jgi:type VI protein secretion system component VasK
MPLGRPLVELVLSADEAVKLTTLARQPKSDQRTALRAWIMLDCASGLSNTKVAERTKSRWRRWASGDSAS